MWADNLPTHRAYYSDRTAFLMALLSSFAYTRFEIDDGASLRPQLELVGLDLVGWFAEGETEGYVAESRDLAVLVFRGTTSGTDWKTNLRVKTLVYATRPDEAPVLVHQGFLNAWRRVDGKVGALITTTGAKPLYITGHSLGGAVAVVASALLDSARLAACYTFGAPRVGNRTFDLYVKPPHYRVVNGWDVVPLAPFAVLMRFAHGGDPRYIRAASTDVARWNRPVLRALGVAIFALVTFPFTGSIHGVRDHAIGLYADILRRIAATQAGPR